MKLLFLASGRNSSDRGRVLHRWPNRIVEGPQEKNENR